MTEIQHAIAREILTGPPTYRRLINARALLRELLHAEPEPHPLQPRGHAHRDRLVAAKLNVRAEA